MIKLDLTDIEIELITMLRGTPYGEITIKLRDGIPYMASWKHDYKFEEKENKENEDGRE